MAIDETRSDIEYGREVLAVEIRAIRALEGLLDERFSRAVRAVANSKGRVVVTGVGKSGLIGQKISATLASTGTSSLFLHSGEAVHGDLGRVMQEDLVLALSYSGTTSEVLRLVPLIKKIGAGLVSITGTLDNPLAQAADLALELGRIAEACPIGLAPTSSTTAMLALGDALSMTVAHIKDFDREQYALYHQGGAIGRKLVQVGEVMRPLAEVTVVSPETLVADAMQRVSAVPTAARASGAVLIADRDGRLLGIFTDGDLRRTVIRDPGILSGHISSVMTAAPKVVRRDELLEDAYRRLKEHKHDELPVVDGEGRAVGILDVQDVLEWGVAF